MEDLGDISRRGSIDFKWNSPLDTFTWNVYTLCYKFNKYATQRENEFQMELLKGVLHP